MTKIVSGSGLCDGDNSRPSTAEIVCKLLISWWALKDLNLRPTDYESAALTAELRARFGCNFLNYRDLWKFHQFSAQGRRDAGASFGVSCTPGFINLASRSIQFGNRGGSVLRRKVSVSHRHL